MPKESHLDSFSHYHSSTILKKISKLLLDDAHDVISDAYLVRSLIEDIRDVRFRKVETGLETVSGRTHAVKLKNLSAIEVNIVHPFMVRTLQAFYKHDREQSNTSYRPRSKNNFLHTSGMSKRRIILSDMIVF